MATKPRENINNALQAKGFKLRDGDHFYFIYYSLNTGKKTSILTKTSRGSKYKIIGDNLLSAMAKQCKLTKADFLNLIDCPLTQENYEIKLRARNIGL